MAAGEAEGELSHRLLHLHLLARNAWALTFWHCLSPNQHASFLVLLAVWPEWRGARPQPAQHTLQHSGTALVDVVIVPAT